MAALMLRHCVSRSLSRRSAIAAAQCLARSGPYSSHRGYHAVANERLPAAASVKLVPFYSDNYAYLVQDVANAVQMVVDPAEAKVVIPAIEAAAEEDGLELAAVLTTHYHYDHAGGNEEVAAAFPGVEIVGPADGMEKTPIPALTKGVRDGDSFSVAGFKVRVLHTPCHTQGHVMYVVTTDDDSTPPLLFSGDMLFAGGCGRFFEGSAEDMHSSLQRVVAELRGDTLVYCGHEYTVSNLRFAAHIEPHNDKVTERLEAAQAAREKGLPTIPSTLAEEVDTNPFLRVHEPSIAVAAGLPEGSDPVKVMAAVRAMKDDF